MNTETDDDLDYVYDGGGDGDIEDEDELLIDDFGLLLKSSPGSHHANTNGKSSGLFPAIVGGGSNANSRTNSGTTRSNTSSMLSQSKYVVPPPLPLLKFEDEKNGENGSLVHTVNGVHLPVIENSFGLPLNANNDKSAGDPLHDPIISRLLMKWFRARANKECIYRQMDEDGLSPNNTTAGSESSSNSNANSTCGEGEYVSVTDMTVYDVQKFGETSTVPDAGSSALNGSEQISLPPAVNNSSTYKKTKKNSKNTN
jgi:hypothetical protein